MIDKLAFAKQFRLDAQGVDMKGIRVDLALTVAGLETGWGTGNIYRNSKNYFSIKAAGWSGPQYKGHRVYRSGGEAIADWVRLISTAPRYRKAYALAVSSSAKDFFKELEISGYAGDVEDPGQGKDYGEKLTATFKNLGRV